MDFSKSTQRFSLAVLNQQSGSSSCAGTRDWLGAFRWHKAPRDLGEGDEELC